MQTPRAGATPDRSPAASGHPASGDPAADAAADAAAALPLAGIRVIDLSAYIAGPYGCALLADLGADVLKVEPPTGDNLRRYPSTLAAEGRAFLGVNRGKRGIALDLKTPAGREALGRLLGDADVLVHNFRPGVPQRLGIDWDSLHARHPALVYCALTGYGDVGPYRYRAGYDQVLQTMTGICTLQGAPGEPEIVYGSVVDYYAAALLSTGVAAALRQRERTGVGRRVDVSLLRSALAMQSARLVWADGEGREVGRDMRSGGITGLHPTQEGALYLSANTPHFWSELCALTGLDALAADPRYDTVRKRAQHADELIPRLRAALATRTARQWEQHFGDRVPCAAALSVEDMFDHPQVAAAALITDYDHPSVGHFRGFDRAVAFDGPKPPPARPAPVFDQHLHEVLRAYGYDDAAIDALRVKAQS